MVGSALKPRHRSLVELAAVSYAAVVRAAGFAAVGLAATAMAVVLPVRAQAVSPADTVAPGAVVRYDLPPQPLGETLRAIGVIGGVDVVARGGVVAGFRAPAVRGELTPRQALDKAVSTTNLVVMSLEAGGFSLAVRNAAPPDLGPASAAVLFGPFASLIQASVMRQLCRYDNTRPGSYRLPLQLWIAPSGRIERAALLGSTGVAARDAAVVEQLTGLRIAERPPMGLPQPATLLLLPQPGRPSPCAQSEFARVGP
ncbi:MAG: hypothetical protein HXX10_26730 [Rhodoplanes sp.]|uniref:STN domain-containing protein n=1 Tax=Rhodoplanes sp. TaxID=1968906 RepID=UPI0017C677B2|nr:STN domain-containing protein [Rhodoplanes sp.]NVO17640.1 hypothetical protein [Rhodoplanes sp.]